MSWSLVRASLQEHTPHAKQCYWRPCVWPCLNLSWRAHDVVVFGAHVIAYAHLPLEASLAAPHAPLPGAPHTKRTLAHFDMLMAMALGQPCTVLLSMTTAHIPVLSSPDTCTPPHVTRALCLHTACVSCMHMHARTTRYSSVDAQKAHWRVHKKSCAKLTDVEASLIDDMPLEAILRRVTSMMQTKGYDHTIVPLWRRCRKLMDSVSAHLRIFVLTHAITVNVRTPHVHMDTHSNRRTHAHWQAQLRSHALLNCSAHSHTNHAHKHPRARALAHQQMRLCMLTLHHLRHNLSTRATMVRKTWLFTSTPWLEA
jgi:hypothetical protein